MAIQVQIIFMGQKQSNLHCTCVITPKRVTKGGAHLRGFARGQHSSEETSQRRRAIGDIVSDLTDLGIEPKLPAPISISLTVTLAEAVSLRFDFAAVVGSVLYLGVASRAKCCCC